MDIKYLQQLDFLLKKVNNHNDSRNFKIVFELNGEIYSGDFVREIYSNKVRYKNVSAYDVDQNKEIGLKNWNDWKQISNGTDWQESDYVKLVKRSKFFKEHHQYLMLLEEITDKYPVEFEEELPSYIYNLERLNGDNPQINFIKVTDNINFGFISLVPQIQNTNHN